ncbi:MAG: hypothetical protein IJQ33_09620 [Clostridia bacterium]|nr:hypothetical protein [Clostridia bacterium]
MAEQKVSRGKKLAGFWLRLVCFAVLAVLLLTYAVYVFTPKSDYGICSMINLYRQPDDSVDVLAVGTSLAYAGINTNVLWEEYGIASYNLCSAEQPFWVSYYTIKEALKTQHPKVILLDAKPAIYTRDYSKRGRTILSTFGIRGIENRVGAILACVENPQDAMGYILGLPEVHSNYEKLTENDFVFPPDNGGRGESWKGYIESDVVEHHQKPSLVYNTVKRNMNDREEEYARKIFELAQEEGITVLLLGLPNPDYANDHMYYNALWAVAEEYGVTGVNYNDPSLRFGLRYSSDFADWQHLNVKGSITFSRKLGADLKEMFDLPDRRGDEKYASYDACAEQWFEQYPTFESSAWEAHPLDWFVFPEPPGDEDAPEPFWDGDDPEPGLPAPFMDDFDHWGE